MRRTHRKTPGWRLPAGGPPGAPPRPEDLDADKDGKVTAAEFANASDKSVKGLFARLDANADAQLSKDEFEKGRTFGPGAGPRGGFGDKRGPQGR